MNSKVKIVSAKKVIEAGKSSIVILSESNFWSVFNSLKSKAGNK